MSLMPAHGLNMRSFLFQAVCLFTVMISAPQVQAQAQIADKLPLCNSCHGADGTPLQADYPVIAGQTARYIYLQLRDFQEGRRQNPVMAPMAATLTRDEMRALAEHYSKQKPSPQKFKADEAKARIGRQRSDDTLCTMCHLGGFAGQNEVPKVAGQNFDYIVLQLKAFKSRTRTNDAGTMSSVANTLSDEDIVNIAHYLAGL
jgi:cytochrome c553